MYIVVSSFKDLTDNEFEYTIGDEFPRKERSIDDITKERLEELTTNKNKKGRILIKEINIEKNTTPDVDKKADPEAKGEPTPDADENVDLEAKGEPTPDADENVDPEAKGEPTPKTDEKNTKVGNKSTKNKN